MLGIGALFCRISACLLALLWFVYMSGGERETQISWDRAIESVGAEKMYISRAACVGEEDDVKLQ